ncbi:DUF4376 domain-containing protein [Bradyrhizobium sp. BRP22]|uniref:DUF4376 domain-containing protein n=1 Tax=Bradyrhizobium sp. BRP22 TaxID=2793821 RepID=UPI001CD41B19|nr:DUF4376 domain-containing protein [Bradyrhizobium sp. BRP22]MCA1452119.1 DUF4376 domain-containing protein [Bradyrhizobium sp. BRP22]
MMYDPYDWYWLADDGRLYSSAETTLVQSDDADYVAWTEAGNVATTWPRDDQGNQTAAELQRVLFPYKLAVDLKAYAFYVGEQKEADGCAITGVAGLTEIRSDANAQLLISRYHQAVASDPSFTVPWILPDRSTVTLTATEINSIYDQLTAFIVRNYRTYSDVIAGVDGGSITTTDQIDTAFGTTLRRSTPVDIGWKT